MLMRMFAEKYPMETRGILLTGSIGCGKTHLAASALKWIIEERGAEGVFCDYRELLRSIQNSYNPQVSATEMEILTPIMNAEVLILDHYLEVLKYKPGALPGATALAQARAAGAFTASHQRYWDAARRARGDANGTRALTEVLLGHRTLPASALTEAMDKAVTSGALDPQAVLIDARRLGGSPAAAVIPIGALARYDRPAPVLAGYDQLLSRGTR